MSLRKRTYALPADLLTAFENQFSAGERSAVIAGLLRECLEQKRREELRRQVVEGCRDMTDLYLAVEKEYHPLEEEVHRALENQPAARRCRSRPPRSGRRV